MSVSSNSSRGSWKDTERHSKGKKRKSPANFLFKETAAQQEERIRKNSPFGKLQTWRLINFIVKTGDDLRQE